MKVVVSAFGRFHSFELARQLHAQGHLQRLYTGYPRRNVSEVGPDLVRSHWPPAVAQRLLERGGFRRTARMVNAHIAMEYDRWVARNLEPSDLVVSLSSFGVETFRAAQRRGAVTVCDRGSSHIAHQAEVLREEYRRFGVDRDPMDQRIIERELVEYEEAEYITVPSHFVRRTFIERGVPESKLVVLPYGVDLRVYRPMPKRDGTFRVLFAGSAGLRKGVQYLLEAAKRLHLQNFEVVLAGHPNPDARTVLDSYGGTFRHIGFVPRLELADVYSQASVLVLPSLEEGLALVQAQAMACGVPVIATPNTGAEDLFTDGVEGLIVPPRDVAALEGAILRLYEKPEMRNEMGQRALQRVQRLGGWNEYGRSATAAYTNMLVDGKRHVRRNAAVEPVVLTSEVRKARNAG